jgi:hypothetical protein
MKRSVNYLLLVILSMVMACSNQQVITIPPDMRTQDDHIREFWQWFKEEKTLFETMTDDTYSERLNLILQHLHLVSNGLAVEVSKEFHGVRDIIISAEGDRSKFQIVKNIVATAPKIRGWTVTAFRQRAKEDFVLRYKDVKYNSAKMFFQPIIEGDSLNLIIYADSLRGKDMEDVKHYGLVTMDNVLGEYDCITKVRYFDFRDLREVKDKSQLTKLTNLPAFIDKFYRNKTVNN